MAEATLVVSSKVNCMPDMFEVTDYIPFKEPSESKSIRVKPLGIAKKFVKVTRARR